MSVQFITIDKPILSIEEYNAGSESIDDITDIVGGYGSVNGGAIAKENELKKLVTIVLTQTRIIKCVFDIEFLNIKEDQKVKIIMCGNKPACIINEAEGKYAYFNSALRTKYNMPRIMSGINMAIVSAVGGYILTLILQHTQSKMGVWIGTSLSAGLCIASILYAYYFFMNEEYGHIKLRQYLKKLIQ